MKAYINAGKSHGGKTALYAMMFFMILVAMVPFAWMLLLSFKSNSEILLTPLSWPQSFSLRNYITAFVTIDYVRMNSNTILVAFISVIGGMILSFMSSFVLAKMFFKHQRSRDILYIYLIAGLAISGFILLFPIYRITAMLHLRDTLWGLMPAYAATTLSFNILLMVAFLRELPMEIDEAAVIDGCNLFQLMSYILIPMAKPVLTTVFVFNIIYVFNEYPIASVLLDSPDKLTLSMSAFQFKGQYSANYGAMIAGSLLIVVPELAFYAFFQRYIVAGMTAGAVKG